MPKQNKPKFKEGQEVVYHEGNWKWIVVQVLWDKDGKVKYFLECNDDSCNHCDYDDDYLCKGLHREKDLMDYDKWCDHTEKGCSKCN
jgi:hypothetical protein